MVADFIGWKLVFIGDVPMGRISTSALALLRDVVTCDALHVTVILTEGMITLSQLVPSWRTRFST